MMTIHIPIQDDIDLDVMCPVHKKQKCLFNMYTKRVVFDIIPTSDNDETFVGVKKIFMVKRYVCPRCKKTVSQNMDDFVSPRSNYSNNVVMYVKNLYKNGYVVFDIVNHIQEKFGIKIGVTTVRTWIKK